MCPFWTNSDIPLLTTNPPALFYKADSSRHHCDVKLSILTRLEVVGLEISHHLACGRGLRHLDGETGLGELWLLVVKVKDGQLQVTFSGTPGGSLVCGHDGQVDLGAGLVVQRLHHLRIWLGLRLGEV